MGSRNIYPATSRAYHFLIIAMFTLVCFTHLTLSEGLFLPHMPSIFHLFCTLPIWLLLCHRSKILISLLVAIVLHRAERRIDNAFPSLLMSFWASGSRIGRRLGGGHEVSGLAGDDEGRSLREFYYSSTNNCDRISLSILLIRVLQKV